MPSNIEIKAKVNNPACLQQIVESIGQEQGRIRQEDTFFAATHGRLKLRQFSPDHGELIGYERPDNRGPAESRYRVSKTHDPKGLCTILRSALGDEGIVCKVRHLFLVGQTRIHLDQVEGLGHFVELEVVLKDGQSSEEGVKVAHDLMTRLGIQAQDLLEKAYIDLLREQQAC